MRVYSTCTTTSTRTPQLSDLAQSKCGGIYSATWFSSPSFLSVVASIVPHGSRLPSFLASIVASMLFLALSSLEITWTRGELPRQHHEEDAAIGAAWPLCALSRTTHLPAEELPQSPHPPGPTPPTEPRPALHPLLTQSRTQSTPHSSKTASHSGPLARQRDPDERDGASNAPDVPNPAGCCRPDSVSSRTTSSVTSTAPLTTHRLTWKPLPTPPHPPNPTLRTLTPPHANSTLRPTPPSPQQPNTGPPPAPPPSATQPKDPTLLTTHPNLTPPLPQHPKRPHPPLTTATLNPTQSPSATAP
uniref:Uncharacterized protein n=1 Tax=Knipowitschia caucasica TaxID=637954 RepID=A0AAV2MKZ4_KNICA